MQIKMINQYTVNDLNTESVKAKLAISSKLLIHWTGLEAME